ncbi:DoxX family membrane protein [Alloacidobacterium dinghuense]|uniref:DoxX family membrane protein n=1 Tax=Alloacidobacterium dinghuense TaxID=2763107 RepID=A0A7G8BPX9_9BACT|nr:DoxX family membrane protein [Alloacidobacterium dinghuense]QNI34599.1 DoxX family membrane protein [Alloacidobacterium dinghuense]
MIPFFVLAGTLIICRLIGWAGAEFFATWQHCLRVAVAAMFLLTASAHWGKRRADLVRMVPPAFPRPEMLVTLTGFAEIAGAVGMLWTPVTKAASLGLAVLLIAMFPANVYAARHELTIAGRGVPGLFMRTVLQIAFLAGVIPAGWC